MSALADASNLAMSLATHRKNAEAEHMLQAVLASCQRMLGPAHPFTLQVARNLKLARARRIHTCSACHGCAFSDEDVAVVKEHEKSHCDAPQLGPPCAATAACTATANPRPPAPAACSVGRSSPVDDGYPGTPPPTPPSPTEVQNRARLVRDMERFLQAGPEPLPQFASRWSLHMGEGAVFDKRSYTNSRLTRHMKLKGLLESIPETVELYEEPGPTGKGKIWWARLCRP